MDFMRSNAFALPPIHSGNPGARLTCRVCQAKAGRYRRERSFNRVNETNGMFLEVSLQATI